MPVPIAPPTDGALPAAPGRASGQGSPRLTPFVVSLFFAWGFATVLIDTLIPKLKALFELSYTEAMLTQFAFFIAYLVVSAPAGRLIARAGYVRGIVIGLLVMMVGCLMFSPAAAAGVYAGFLAALFVMASGITILQVAANPLVARLGSARTAHSRLNLAQALNSLGTFVGPFVGAALILDAGLRAPAGLEGDALAAFRRTEAEAVQVPFLGIALGLALLAGVFWLLRRDHAPADRAQAAAGSGLALLRGHPRLALGALSLFLYVGAEVAIGSILVNFLMRESVLGLTAADAGRLVALYWGGAMVGRLVGSAVMLRVPAARVLLLFATGAMLLTAAAAGFSGAVSGIALIAVGLCNSIMFPTVFSLSIEGMRDETPRASGVLCMAIVGGAIVPVLTGALADLGGLDVSLMVPLACYLWIAVFAALVARGALPPAQGPS